MNQLINRVFQVILLPILLMVALSSCSVGQAPVLLELAELPNEGRICRVAVLPFANSTAYPRGAIIVSRVFNSELIESGHMTLAQEGDVRKFLQQMRIMPGTTLMVEQVRALADRLDVDVVISASIIEMQDKPKDGRSLEPSVALIIRLHDGDSGRTLWTSYSRKEGWNYRKIMHFGVVNTVPELVDLLTKEIVELWFDKGMKKCES